MSGLSEFELAALRRGSNMQDLVRVNDCEAWRDITNYDRDGFFMLFLSFCGRTMRDAKRSATLLRSAQANGHSSSDVKYAKGSLCKTETC